jgi:hypothetical protein
MRRDEIIRHLAIGIGMQEGHTFTSFGQLGEPIQPGPQTMTTAREVLVEAEMLDGRVLTQIAEWLRNPEWAVGMLEDIAAEVHKTGRFTHDYPDRRSTWGRH